MLLLLLLLVVLVETSTVHGSPMEQEHLLLAVLSVLVLPMILILFTVIVLASLGKSLGVRKRYVKLLLKIFQVS